MDFANAAVLVAAIYGVTELAKSLLPPKWKAIPQVIVLLTLVIALGVTFLFASTVWAHTQVIGGVELSKLGTGDKFLVGLMLGGAASFLNRGIGAVRNIGENQPPPPEVK